MAFPRCATVMKITILFEDLFKLARARCGDKKKQFQTFISNSNLGKQSGNR